ncbi:MAG: LpxI family protein, partial [Blastocatellia bacterium]
MKFGLIAGNGRFPFLVLEGARAEGVEMAVAAIKEETDPKIESLAGAVEWISVGHLNKLIKFFQREGVTQAVMAGQVKHVQIFKLNALPDLRMARMLARLK